MLNKEKIENVLLCVCIIILCYSICYCLYSLRNPLAPFKNIITKPIDIITFQKKDEYQFTLENIFKGIYLYEHERGY